MKPQVNKTTRSTIVKSITAAVLLAACTTTLSANTSMDSEIKELGRTASAAIQADFISNSQNILLQNLNTAITASTGVKDISAYNKFTKESPSTIVDLGTQASAAVQSEFIAQAQANLSESLNHAVQASINTNAIVAQNVNTSANLLPSIAAFANSALNNSQHWNTHDIVTEVAINNLNFVVQTALATVHTNSFGNLE